VINPIIIRHARIQFRSDRTGPVMVLASYLLILVLAFFLTYMVGSYRGMSWEESLANYWHGLFAIQAFVLIVVGSLKVAGTVVREKERKRFDFQLVTGMSPWKIAEGEMMGSTLLYYSLILCTLPFAVLCVLGGGLSLETFGYSYLLLFAGAFFFHSWALLASTVSRSYAGAIVTTLIILAVLSTAAIFRQSPSETLKMISAISPFYLPYSRLQAASEPLKLMFFNTPFPELFSISAMYFFFGLWAMNAAVRRIRNPEAPYISKLQAVIFVAISCTVIAGVLSARQPGLSETRISLFYENTAIYLTLSFLLLVVLAFVLSPSARSYETMKRRGTKGFWNTVFGERSLYFVNLLILFGVSLGIYFGVYFLTFPGAPDLTKALDGKLPLADILVSFFFVLLASLFYSLLVQLGTIVSRRAGREIVAFVLLILILLPGLSELWHGAPEEGFVLVFNPVVVILATLPIGAQHAATNLPLTAIVFYFIFCSLLGALLFLRLRNADKQTVALQTEIPAGSEA